jgi:hypothetical protein
MGVVGMSVVVTSMALEQRRQLDVKRTSKESQQKAPALQGRPGLLELVAGGGFEPPTFGL